MAVLFDASATEERFNRLLQTEQRIELLSRYQELFDFQASDDYEEGDEDDTGSELDGEGEASQGEEEEVDADVTNTSMEVEVEEPTTEENGPESSVPAISVSDPASVIPNPSSEQLQPPKDSSEPTPTAAAMEVDETAINFVPADERADGEGEGNGEDEDDQKRRGRPKRPTAQPKKTRKSTRGKPTRRRGGRVGTGSGDRFSLKRVDLLSSQNPDFAGHQIPAGKDIPATAIMVDSHTLELIVIPVISLVGKGKAKKIAMTVSCLQVILFFSSFFSLPVS